MVDESQFRSSALTTVTKAVILALAAAGFLAISAGQAHATHVSCGDTITTDTKLDSDLIDCPSSGVVIGADDITLELNGYVIDGDPIPFGDDVGVSNRGGFDGTVVTGPGVIKEFSEHGVFIAGSSATVRGLTVSDNGFGAGIAISGDDGEVRRNTVSENGISIEGSRNRVEGNHVSTSLIEPHRCADCIVRKNVLFDGGVVLDGGTRNLIERNSVLFGSIILLPDSLSGAPAENNRLEHNLVFQSDEAGIALDTANSNLVRKNSTSNNAVGIAIGGSGNTVEKNSASDNAFDGIQIGSDSTGTLLEGNRANDNGNIGILVDSPATTLTKNTANDNGDLGIAAVPGVTDGGGNKAKRNGNPLQCTNVACK